MAIATQRPFCALSPVPSTFSDLPGKNKESPSLSVAALHCTFSKLKQLESRRVIQTAAESVGVKFGLDGSCCPRGEEGGWTWQSPSGKSCLMTAPRVGRSFTALSLERWHKTEQTGWTLAESLKSASWSKHQGGAKKVKKGTGEMCLQRGCHPDFVSGACPQREMQLHPDSRRIAGRCNYLLQRAPYSSGPPGAVQNIRPLPPVYKWMDEAALILWRCLSSLSIQQSTVQLCLLILLLPLLELLQNITFYTPLCALGNLLSCPGVWLLNCFKVQ